MNSFKDHPEMARMTRELDEHSDYDSNGDRVKNTQGFYVLICQSLKYASGG